MERNSSGRFKRQSTHCNGKKQCGNCKKWKPITEFHKHSQTWDGRRWRCNDCQKDYYLSYRPKTLANHRRRLYNLDEKSYEKLLAEQNNVCAICHQPETAKQGDTLRALCVDHSHTTKKNRGLLCVKCNHVLGHANDNPEILQNAIAYLNKYV